MAWDAPPVQLQRHSPAARPSRCAIEDLRNVPVGDRRGVQTFGNAMLSVPPLRGP